MKRISVGTFAAAIAVLFASAASAHVSFEAKEAKVGGGYKAVLNVPHGCEGTATNEVSVDIPEGIIAVKPMPKPGWKISLEKGPYARTYDFYHGEKKSEGVKKITWSGGELPDDYFDQFVFSTYVAGELAPGSKLAFPVTQKCATGELRWTEVAAPGVDPHSLDHPAPLLSLIGGSVEEHHHHGAGGIELSGAWTRPANAGNMGVGYVKITNEGAEPDTLLGASSDAADRVELHETSISPDGVASMKKVDAVEIAPGKSIELKPGGLHLMLVGLKDAIKDGGKVKAQLNFKKAGAVDVEFDAANVAPQAAEGHEHMHHQH